jgi:hypothetical protein
MVEEPPLYLRIDIILQTKFLCLPQTLAHLQEESSLQEFVNHLVSSEMMQLK